MNIPYKNPKQRKEEVRNGLFYAFGLLVLSATILLLIYQNFQIDIEKNIDQIQLQEVEAMSKQTLDVFARIEAYLVHASKLYSVKHFLKSEAPQMRKEVERFFANLITTNAKRYAPRFDQIRLLDLNGMERVRVDLSGDNDAEICRTDKLQDKSNRYYFNESIALSENQIYISPLDLNMEKGKIEIPHKPMMRFVISVYGDDGRRLGFLIFNYLGKQLFSILDHMNLHEEDQWILLNRDGYYLHHPDTNKRFGFMFPGKKVGFFSEYPDLWAQLQNNSAQKITHPKGLFYRKNIKTLGNKAFLTVTQYRDWTLLMFVPLKNIRQKKRLLNKSSFIAGIILVPTFVLLGWFLGESRTKNKWFLKCLIERATQDGLTGLLNYHEIIERLNYQISLSKRLGIPLSIAYIDLNDLKLINDSFGHESGDKVIISAAESIKTAIRITDIASRIGGDEFLLVFPTLELGNAKKVIFRIEQLYAQKGMKLFEKELTFSWGVALWEGESDTLKSLIARADRAMYIMKSKVKSSRNDAN